MIKATLQPLPQPHRVVLVEDDYEKLKKMYDACWNEVREAIEVRGFKKGSVPRSVAEKKIGAEKLYKSVVDTLIQEGLSEIEQRFCDIGEVSIQWQTEDKPLVLYVKGYLFPEIQSCDYKEIVSNYTRLMVTDEEVNSLMMRAAYSEAEEIEVDISEEDDPSRVQVFIDFIMDDVEEQQVIANQKGYKVDLSRNSFGFEEEILKHKKGEIFEVECILPDDFFQKELANKKVRYQIKIDKMFRFKLPEVDDVLAQKIGYKTLQEMREKIIKDLEEDKRNADQLLYRDHIMSLLVAKTKVTPIPDAIIKSELEKMLEGAVKTANQMQGSSVTVDQFLSSAKMKKEEWFNANWPLAQKKIIGNLALQHIAKKEKICATKEQCQKMLEEMLPEGVDPKQSQVNEESLREYVVLKLAQDRLIELIEKDEEKVNE